VVDSIEETANMFDIPKSFLGLFLLPIAVSITGATSRSNLTDGQTNAAQLVTSVSMAKKNKMDLTIGICVGSSIVRCIYFSSLATS
jgi:Ca2+:H+ antiporter